MHKKYCKNYGGRGDGHIDGHFFCREPPAEKHRDDRIDMVWVAMNVDWATYPQGRLDRIRECIWEPN